MERVLLEKHIRRPQHFRLLPTRAESNLSRIVDVTERKRIAAAEARQECRATAKSQEAASGHSV